MDRLIGSLAGDSELEEELAKEEESESDEFGPRITGANAAHLLADVGDLLK